MSFYFHVLFYRHHLIVQLHTYVTLGENSFKNSLNEIQSIPHQVWTSGVFTEVEHDPSTCYAWNCHHCLLLALTPGMEWNSRSGTERLALETASSSKDLLIGNQVSQ
jgi:hypothetical protein